MPKIVEPPRSNLIPFEEDETLQRPEPYILRITETGLVTVGWDQRMLPPNDYKEIPEKKVAIDDISAFTQDEINDRISYGWFIYEDLIEAPLKLALIDSLEVRILR